MKTELSIMDTQTKVTGVILAGGLGRRMGNRDKGLVLFNGQPLVSYAIAVMNQLTGCTFINANRNIQEYQEFGLPVISDQTDNYAGPLAGVLAGMAFAEPGVLLIMPCDSPFVKAEHIDKLLTSLVGNRADIAVAYDGERLHPVFLAIKTDLKASLQNYLQSSQRKVETWLEQHNTVRVDFSGEKDIFTNINSQAELAELAMQNPR